MKKSFLVILVCLLTVICIWLIYSNSRLHNRLDKVEKRTSADGGPHHEEHHEKHEEEEEEFELAVYMGRMQLYMNKLWYSGENENWELAEFYVEETEECMEEIEHCDEVEEGVELNKAIVDWGLNPLKEVETAVKQKDKKVFFQKYDMMVANCNSCHTATQHAFIRIQKPDHPAFTNQDYTPH